MAGEASGGPRQPAPILPGWHLPTNGSSWTPLDVAALVTVGPLRFGAGSAGPSTAHTCPWLHRHWSMVASQSRAGSGGDRSQPVRAAFPGSRWALRAGRACVNCQRCTTHSLQGLLLSKEFTWRHCRIFLLHVPRARGESRPERTGEGREGKTAGHQAAAARLGRGPRAQPQLGTPGHVPTPRTGA